MAFDTVIDKAQLETAMTASADAIREKTGGTSPIVWDTDKGFSDAIRTIQTGGSAPLPELTNPADEASVVEDMEFIGADGTVKTGTMQSLGLTGICRANEDSEIAGDNGSKTLFLSGTTTNSTRRYVDPGSSIGVYMSDTDEKMSMFGNARPEDVVAGKIFTSKEGFAKVGTHVCTGDAGSKPVILEVEKITSNTYVNGTSYTNEEFIALDIYPKSGGTVNVTYGDLTKTIVDDGTSENPPAQLVFFGTFGGVTDEVETPASGGLIIEGDYAAFGIRKYNKTNKATSAFYGVTEIVDFGNVEYIPDYAFGDGLSGCNKLDNVHLPHTVKSIGMYAFSACENLPYIAFPRGMNTLGEGTFYGCKKLRDVILPNSLTRIDAHAMYHTNVAFITIPESVTSIGKYSLYSCLSLVHVRLLSSTPPTIGENLIQLDDTTKFESFIVPAGCGEAYKTAEGWSAYADYIMEDAETEAAG